jgi:large subunit ribosomal protein L17
MANLLKSLILNERIITTLPKAKVLRSYADKMITIAKKDTLAARRQAIAELMIRYNKLTPKEARASREGDTSSWNGDRSVLKQLDLLADRFKERNGGYTRIIKSFNRVGDNAQTCVIEYLS